jgi:hypothetical protein
MFSFGRCLFDLGVLQESRPEVGYGTSVVDFKDVELLHDLTIKVELSLFKFGDDLFSKVNSEEVLKSSCGLDVLFSHFNLLLNLTCITLVLENGSY